MIPAEAGSGRSSAHELFGAPSVLPPEITAGVTDRADEPVMQIANLILPFEVREEDFMRQRLGIHFRHLKLAHGDDDEKAEVVLVHLCEIELVNLAVVQFARHDGRQAGDRRIECVPGDHVQRRNLRDGWNAAAVNMDEG